MWILSAILCASDFSEPSRLALRWAAGFAVVRRQPLVILSAVDPLLHEAARVKAGVNLARDQVAPALREFAAGVVPPDAPWAPAVVFDVPVAEAADGILEGARRHDADLVVMGTQGLGGFRKLLLGSTTERVLRQAHTPVLAVPPGATHGIVADHSGVRVAPGRILVGTDFSDAAGAALRWAVDAARTLSASVVLTHVVHETDLPSQWRAYAAELDEERVAAARARLTRLAADACAGVSCEVVVAMGGPADALPSIAQAHEAGLIVLGLAASEGLLSRRPGSIAYPVLCRAQVPVLVVPGPQPNG